MTTLRQITFGASAATLLAAGATAAQERITVYTSQPNEQMARVVELFNEDHPEIEVEVFRSGTTEVMSKLQAEFAAGSTPADVLLIADAVAMTQLKNDDRLMTYENAPTGGIPDSMVDADGTYFGTKLITTGIVYNTEMVEEAPESWQDLADPELARSLIMPSPLYSGAATIHVGTLVQQPQLGWDYYETLADNGAVAGQGNGSVIEAVARGEKAYGIIIDYMALNAKADGSPVDFVFPEEGVTSITQPVAILSSTDNEESAKTFVDWQLGEAAQRHSVEQGYFPVLEGVSPPEGYPEPASLTIMEADPSVMLENDTQMKQKFADLFGG